MYKGLRFAVIAPCLNEEDRITRVVQRVRSVGIADEIIVVDDGSTDHSAAFSKKLGATVLHAPKSQGVGAALRAGLAYAAEHYPVAVIIAGNDKDDPFQIPRLLDPIVAERADFVQGSRYLPGGGVGGGMPWHRRVATRLHPFLFSCLTRKKLTESTNGFRAFRLGLLADPRLDLYQSWLDHYELEPYLLYKALTLGYRCEEVPVTKVYPPVGERYTRMRAGRDWWSILRPLVLLRLGLRT